MAKHKYKQYNGKRSNANTRYLILALSVIIVGTILLIKSRNNNPAAYGVNSGGNDAGGNVLDLSDNSGSNGVDGSDNVGGASGSDTERGNDDNTQPGNGTEVKPPEPVKPLDTTNIAPQTLKLIRGALLEVEKGNIIAARDTLNTVLSKPLTPEYRKSVKARLSELAGRWLFNNKVLPGDALTEHYRVHPGEALANIGRKFKVPHEIIMRINGIKDPRRLQAGQTIKVIKGPFHVKVYRSSFTMDLYLGNEMFIKSYGVGLGAEDKETPVGRWRLQNGGKLIEPAWTDPDTNKRMIAGDPGYPLGSRWIAIEGIDENTKRRTGFALHGTKNPDSIGKRSSRGCIRLFNGDVIEVYNLLVPIESKVLISD